MTVVKNHNLDDVLKKFNIFGWYHAKILVLLWFANLISCLSCMNFVFVAEATGYRCLDERFGEDSCASLPNSSEVCKEWVYDEPHSFVAEFNLACQEWKRTLIGTVYMAGYMVGLLFVGPLSDRFGRKTATVIYGICLSISGVSSSVTTSYWLFLNFQFLNALFDVYSPIFVLGMEIVTHNKRVLFYFFVSQGFSIGFAGLAFIAWLFPYWRHMLRAIFLPCLLILFYWFLLDESPRWLLTKGRSKEAKTILEKAAKASNILLEQEALENLQYQEEQGIGYLKLLAVSLRSKILLLRFFLSVTWFAVSTFIVYGLRISTMSLAGSKYVNYALMSIMAIFASCIATFAMIRFRRKTPLMFSFLFCSLLCFLQILIPEDLPWLTNVLHMIEYLTSSVFFAMVYVFVSEIFPTFSRNTMFSLCSSLGRVGSISATQLPLLLAYWKGLPTLVLGLAGLLAGSVTMLAPDAADEKLPDTVDQAEALDKPSVRNTDSTSRKRQVVEVTKC